MRTLLTSRPRSRRLLVTVAALAVLLGGAGAGAAVAVAGSTPPLTPFTVASPDFRDGGQLPRWTEFGGPLAAGTGCSGKNLAPELDWRNAPSGTAGYALLVNDMDAALAGGWHHWVVYNIPGTVSQLKGHGVPQFTQGSSSWDVNGFPVVGWGGPCPPPDGQTHHYIFTLYALSTATIPGDSLTYEQVLGAIGPYVVGSTVIIGTFRRTPSSS